MQFTNTRLSRPVTGKDLSSFADQLESVANQIKDLATASRLETLASRTRRLLVSHVQPLEQRKEDLVYQLTALEVQMQPLQRQVNQSLSHLKTIQYFINNQGDSICKQKTKEYARRLLGYADQCRDHVLAATGERLAPCRPLWDVFHALRQLLCRHILDPLNGFWFSCVCCLLLFLVACPLCLKLADLCRDGGLMQPGSSDSPSEALMMPESNTWASNNRPVESDGW
ncbi:prominin-1-A [Bacillus rossius redtenbacheri]|uniref:prominin-1-A n=1 Tax=Bacillus rossius redtenbacheri TaxID=93214 RepID=UPI002FDCE3E0